MSRLRVVGVQKGIFMISIRPEGGVSAHILNILRLASFETQRSEPGALLRQPLGVPRRPRQLLIHPSQTHLNEQ